MHDASVKSRALASPWVNHEMVVTKSGRFNKNCIRLANSTYGFDRLIDHRMLSYQSTGLQK